MAVARDRERRISKGKKHAAMAGPEDIQAIFRNCHLEFGFTWRGTAQREAESLRGRVTGKHEGRAAMRHLDRIFR